MYERKPSFISSQTLRHSDWLSSTRTITSAGTGISSTFAAGGVCTYLCIGVFVDNCSAHNLLGPVCIPTGIHTCIHIHEKVVSWKKHGMS